MLLFAGGLAFFGVFFAVPLRRQTILREKLVFPSGEFVEVISFFYFFLLFLESRDIVGVCLVFSCCCFFFFLCLGTATAELIKILHNTKGRDGMRDFVLIVIPRIFLSPQSITGPLMRPALTMMRRCMCEGAATVSRTRSFSMPRAPTTMRVTRNRRMDPLRRH
jgi:hypothetical protein